MAHKQGDSMNEIIDDCRISFHVVGHFSNDMVHIQPLNPQQIWDKLDFSDIATLRYICAIAVCRDASGKIIDGMEDEPATLIGVVRVQREGDKLACYHSFFVDPDNPSSAHQEVMNGAILRVMVDGTGHLNPAKRYQAESAIEDTKLAEELGIKFNLED